MEIRVLQYFLAVVREESITKAADALHITQPTLSRQMTGLEEEILQLVDKTQQELVEQEEKIEGKITIGCGELASVRYMMNVIQEFHRTRKAANGY